VWGCPLQSSKFLSPLSESSCFFHKTIIINLVIPNFLLCYCRMIRNDSVIVCCCCLF
jgi:hypothetical protein